MTTIISAIVLALAFPKFNLSFVAWFALVPFFLAIEKTKKPGSAAFLGFIFGVVFFGINLFWVTTLSNYVGFYAVLGWACLTLFQSIYIIIFAYFTKRFNLSLTIWAGILWVVLEIVRGMGAFGVAGGVLAYSQTNYLPLIQIASIASVYSVSLLIVIANIAIARLIEKKDFSLLISTAILILFVVIYGYAELNNNSLKPATERRNREVYSQVPISIIQGNIPQEKKLDSQFNREIFDIHKNLTLKAAAENPKIIIWPETTILTYLLRDDFYLSQIKQLARTTRAYLIIGTPYYDEKMSFYNSAVVISPSGEVAGRYDKQLLVPFGEYLPLRSLTFPLLKGAHYFGSDFSPGPNSLPLDAGGIKIGTVICFESTFPRLVKERSAKGAQIFLVITNDAWFKDSSAPYEHFDNAIFRAVENRKYFIQVANTGISAFIDPYGRVIKKLDLNKRGYLNFNLKP